MWGNPMRERSFISFRKVVSAENNKTQQKKTTYSHKTALQNAVEKTVLSELYGPAVPAHRKCAKNVLYGQQPKNTPNSKENIPIDVGVTSHTPRIYFS